VDKLPARIGGARIQDPGDVRMVHEGQGLALGLKTRDDLPGVHAQLDDLEGDAAMDRLLLLGHIDHSAAAFTDLLEELVAADAVSGLFDRKARSAGGGLLEKTARRLRGREELFDAPEQGVIAGAGAGKVKGALCGGQAARLIKESDFALRQIIHGSFGCSILSKAKCQSKRRKQKKAQTPRPRPPAKKRFGVHPLECSAQPDTLKGGHRTVLSDR
jgi:hypothetical protein